MRRIQIPAWTGVYPDSLALRMGEARQGEVVQVNESRQKRPGWIELDREPGFGEVNLYLVGAFFQAATHLSHMLVQEILDKCRARITRNALIRIHEAQC